MLKSRFNLNPEPDEEDEEKPEQPQPKEEDNAEEIEAEAVVEEQKVVYPERVLKKSEVAVRLSFLGKTADGDGYTYLKATLTNMSLTNIEAIKYYRHLQFVDVSDNSLDLEALQAIAELPYLVLIHADKNYLKSAALKKCKYLQVMILNYNKLRTVEDVFQVELCTLEVGYNNITEIKFKNRMAHLKCLDFRYNMIHDISDINFPMLDSLYLAGNKIKSLIGIETLINLRILHLRNNPIKLLDGFDAGMTNLRYINLRNCRVSTLRQVKKLRVLPGLETLVMKGCPYMGGTGEETAEAAQEEEDSEVRVEVLATLPRLKKLNKSIFSEEESTEAKEMMKLWIEEGEKEEDEEVEEEEHEEHEEEDE